VASRKRAVPWKRIHQILTVNCEKGTASGERKGHEATWAWGNPLARAGPAEYGREEVAYLNDLQQRVRAW
jgi:hypothetical protein